LRQTKLEYMNGFFKVPVPTNEPVLDYAPGSKERVELKNTLEVLRSKVIEIPMFIGGKEVKTDKLVEIYPPHDRHHLVAKFHKGNASHVEAAVEAALAAKPAWEKMPWEQRAAIFLKAAELISGPYRAKLNAATMIGQSKNAYQAEIDSACEIIDFLRFNVAYMSEIYAEQPPLNSKGVWNRMEYRPLEGFVFALTPFNFTAIAGNLPTSAAMMGNVVVWKPAFTQIYSANVLMEIFREAGVPDGVINLIYTEGPETGSIVFKHPDFAGIHFTGSTGVFQKVWSEIGQNIHRYKTYPRIVGETGGKDFVMVHHTANPHVVATALARGAFEYQGQKCSAASRAYIPQSLWNEVKELLISQLRSMKMGPTEDFSNFINAVIDEKAFDKITSYIDNAKKDKEVELVFGGEYDKSKGFFIQPTVLLTSNPSYVTMCEELFGPVLSIFVYDDAKFEETLDIVDKTSPYALTGSILSADRYAIALATEKLKNAAGNFYINDKPTGAVVGQQPFGGARGSGTNDKAGAKVNLLRWVSQRTIKETFVPPTDYKYPFLTEE
jgi:1-pyrroline-5-carboxylate dehydrogenase